MKVELPNKLEMLALKKLLFEHLEDHDNAELPENEWQLWMESYVIEFNDAYNCNFHVKNSVKDYIEYKYKQDR